ncbi:MAG: hypothetical protein FJ117_06020 [Deltaproteobacteria bacterium]|nr:hypothetical protein [Deltaproteobacteria bacterium]
MPQSIFFDKRQRFLVGETLKIAETLAGDYFRINLEDIERFPYDLQTLANLKSQEKTRRALAQICKYEYHKKEPLWKFSINEFYRICLQDDKILDAARAEASSLPLLKPLLLYVVTHELVHVIRFSQDPQRFYLKPAEKKVEEKNVHRMTYQILKPFSDPQVRVLLEKYRPWWEDLQGRAPEGLPLTNPAGMPNFL